MKPVVPEGGVCRTQHGQAATRDSSKMFVEVMVLVER